MIIKDNDYSEHFGKMTSGTKLFVIEKEHVLKKFSFDGPR